MAIRPSALFFLPNTTTVLARSAINHLRAAAQPVLDEAITTVQNRNLSAAGLMPFLEQSVHFAEVLEKLSKDWSPETVRAFSAALNMDPTKTDVMDLIVALAILNEPDLEAELRGENTPETTASDLLENRRITWQYPPPGTVLTPPYVVLVAVEHVDTTAADSEVQAILGELVDYKGFRIPRRAIGPVGRPPIRPDILVRPDILSSVLTAPLASAAITQPAATSPAAPAAPSAPAAAPPAPTKTLAGGRSAVLASGALSALTKSSSRFIGGL